MLTCDNKRCPRYRKLPKPEIAAAMNGACHGCGMTIRSTKTTTHEPRVMKDRTSKIKALRGRNRQEPPKKSKVRR
jgi:hypothetical protein